VQTIYTNQLSNRPIVCILISTNFFFSLIRYSGTLLENIILKKDSLSHDDIPKGIFQLHRLMAVSSFHIFIHNILIAIFQDPSFGLNIAKHPSGSGDRIDLIHQPADNEDEIEAMYTLQGFATQVNLGPIKRYD
jgi:hypothetical protein